MTSSQESSKSDSTRASVKDVESLAGLFHPHAIEVQDFSYYRLILDLRSQPEFDDDHIPGAVRLETARGLIANADAEPMSTELDGAGGPEVSLPPDLASQVAQVKLDQAILVYCGRGGRDSLAVARTLRWRGWTVDVLPGGWTNYRRWVQAGLETLPRLIAFRVVTASLSGEMARLLAGLSRAGQQVLDVATIAGWREGVFTPMGSVQPAQSGFESRLLQELRQIEPHRPVWVADLDRQLGGVSLPGPLLDAISVAPTAALACPLAERLARWREDEPLLNGSVDEIPQVAAATPALTEPPRVDPDVAHCDAASELARLLTDRDERWRARVGAGSYKRPNLPALVTSSLALDCLREAIERWLPLVQRSVQG